jgi:hypothetical protein
MNQMQHEECCLVPSEPMLTLAFQPHREEKKPLVEPQDDLLMEALNDDGHHRHWQEQLGQPL